MRQCVKTWSIDETKILTENYNAVSNVELLRLLPKKSKQAIYKKAYKMGLRKTKEIEFLNRSEAMKGNKSPNWKGGKKRTSKGYAQVLIPEHPRADSSGYVMEHIAVWEQKTGVSVPDNCCVHHLNGNKSDNRIENLCLMQFGAHTKLHNTGRKVSDKFRETMSIKARERFSDKRNHPFYKAVDMEDVLARRARGEKVSDICKAYGISKRTYYDKLKDVKDKNAQ